MSATLLVACFLSLKESIRKTRENDFFQILEF